MGDSFPLTVRVDPPSLPESSMLLLRWRVSTGLYAFDFISSKVVTYILYKHSFFHTLCVFEKLKYSLFSHKRGSRERFCCNISVYYMFAVCFRITKPLGVSSDLL